MKNELADIVRDIKSYLEFEKVLGVEGYFKSPVIIGESNEFISCSGNRDARLIFIGESLCDNGAGEFTFSTESGVLLKKIVEAIGLRSEDVYAINIFKEIIHDDASIFRQRISDCRDYLKKNIENIDPDVICVLGDLANRILFESDEPISKVHGKFYQYNGIKVMPTFHPEHLLNNANDKKLVWEDMKKIMELLR